MVQNNQTILMLLLKYSGDVKTNEFRVQSEKFRDHAIRYNDRWRSLIEVYSSKGDFPTAAPAFPTDFPSAVQIEIAARQGSSQK
jgi:hypothetical protein